MHKHKAVIVRNNSCEMRLRFVNNCEKASSAFVYNSLSIKIINDDAYIGNIKLCKPCDSFFSTSECYGHLTRNNESHIAKPCN